MSRQWDGLSEADLTTSFKLLIGDLLIQRVSPSYYLGCNEREREREREREEEVNDYDFDDNEYAGDHIGDFYDDVSGDH